jgi:hypothetical protein
MDEFTPWQNTADLRGIVYRWKLVGEYSCYLEFRDEYKRGTTRFTAVLDMTTSSGRQWTNRYRKVMGGPYTNEFIGAICSSVDRVTVEDLIRD